MKIRKIIAALILPGLLLAGLIGGKLVEKPHSSEVKATDANATLVGVYSANDFNNTEFGGGYNNVLITYTGAAHGLSGDPIQSADVLNKIKINGTTLTESGWGVIPWAGQLWFKIVHPSTVVSGDVLEIESGLNLGDATFGNSLHLRLNENSKWEVFVPEVAPNSTYSSIYNDDYNNTQFAGDYNQVLIVYTGVAHGLTADAITTQDVKDKVTINGTPIWGVIPWADQLWFRIIYPSSVNEGDILEVQNGFTLGAAVLKGFKLRLNSSSKWEYVPDDYGTIVFTQTTSDSSITGIFGVNTVENDLPAGWDSEAFHPADENSGVFIGNERVGTEIKKVSATVYYIAVSGADVDTIATVKGTWKNSTAQFTVQEFTRQWNGTAWVVPVVDYGTFVFDGANGDSTINNFYAINWTNNDLPEGWETEAFVPADENSGTFINGVRVGDEIKKLGPNTYYVKVTGAEVDSVVTIKGNWKNSTAKFAVEEISRQWNGSNWVTPVIDYSTLTFAYATKSSTISGIYGYVEATNDLPGGWDTEAFAPADENSGVFINNERVGTEIKKVDAHSYYIAVADATIGSIVTVKGAWKNSSAKFSVEEFSRQWNGTSWELPLEDYDVVSLADANLPEVSHAAIDTINPQGYGYSDDPAQLGKQRGVFGLTNDSQSFAFQFNFEADGKMTDWFDVRIGVNGAWNAGDFIMFKFTNIWAAGCVQTKRFVDGAQVSGDNEVSTDVSDGQRLLEMGAIKVEDSASTYFVYFKNNGHIDFSTYWDLGEDLRTTVVSLYSTNTNVTIRNSVNPESHNVTLDKVSSTSSALYFDTESDLLPPVHNWDEYFIPVEDGVTLNFNSVTEGKYNYFKKPSENQLYLDLSELGVAPEEGDILCVGGMFKMAHNIGGVLTAYKLNLKDAYYEFVNNAWDEISEERYAEILAHTKLEAKNELDAYVNSDVYDAENLAIVQGIVDAAESEIESATKIDAVLNILEDAKIQIASQAKTKATIVEEEILDSDVLLEQYLENYDVVTTTDFSAVGDMVFLGKGEGGYSSGGYDDTTTRFITSSNNPDGNLIFQFNYESTNPVASEYGSQIFIRMRGDDANCYRFEIGNNLGGSAGVGISRLQNDIAVSRETYDAHFEANTSYKVECGAIDLLGYARTLLFIRINDVMVLSEIVDQIADQSPVIRIMDSYTSEGAVTRLSPIEEGTTKSQNNPSLLGRLILDESSNKSALFATLKGNALPEGAELFPLEKGAFTINGEEVNSWRSVTNVVKVSDGKYRINFDSSELADGAVVHVGGYFSYLDSELVKSGYRFFDAEFVYHASTDSWSQNVPSDRETLIYEAKETLSGYANLDNYSSENQASITAIVDEYLSKIEAAETENISSVLAEALAKIDAIPTLLDEAKAAAKAELAAYRSADLYRDEEKAELASILSAANAQIDAAADEAAIAAIVANAKAAIDELKTAEQRDAEDLAAKKKTGKAEVTALASLLEMDRYSDENQSALSSLTSKALADIDAATSEAEVDSIVAKYRADIIEVETKDGSTFNGETYTGGSQEGEGEGQEGGSGEEGGHEEQEEMTFFQRLVNSIKNFFKKIADMFKNLFGLSA